VRQDTSRGPFGTRGRISTGTDDDVCEVLNKVFTFRDTIRRPDDMKALTTFSWSVIFRLKIESAASTESREKKLRS
jgi:hypothetical protein